MFKLALVFGLVTLTVANFQEECLNAHNKYRSMHSAAPLKLDKKLMESAQKVANILARKNVFHRSRNNRGGNVYPMRKGTAFNGTTAVDYWYNKKSLYNWDNPGYNKATSDFTQVVWKGSTHLGCAYAMNLRTNFIVAMYSPHGNIDGKFRENVTKN